MNHLIIRADSGTDIGTGHIMRCLALAQTWQDHGGEVTFVSASSNPAIVSRLQKEKMNVAVLSSIPGSISDVRETCTIAVQKDAEWIVVDGYQFGPEYQKYIKKSGKKILFIDDYGQCDFYCADIVLNPNSYSNEQMYSNRTSYTRLLLGLRYVLIRREFWDYRKKTCYNRSDVTNILVTLGGSDPNNVTSVVVDSLKKMDSARLNVTVVVGGANPHQDILKKQVRHHDAIVIRQNVENMPELMDWADIAISGAGSTCWELIFMQVPFLMIIIAENQQRIAMDLHESGAAINLGWYSNIQPPDIAQTLNDIIMSENKRQIINDNQKRIMQYAHRDAVIGELIKKGGVL